MKKKIICTTGTRAEYGVLRSLLYELKTNKKFELKLIVTGTHLSKKYGMTINEIRKDGFKIHDTVNSLPKGNSMYDMSISLGDSIIQFSKIFRKIKPDINVIIADRDEMLASALAAYHMNIPNAHIHGGEISGGIDEYNRHAITKISNIHFTPTQKTYERIIGMGERAKYVIKTGALAIDEIKNNKISKLLEIEKKVGFDLKNGFILLLQHSDTIHSKQSSDQILNTLKVLAKTKIKTIAIAPNSDAGSKEILEHLSEFSKKYDFIKFFKNFPRNDYLSLLKNCDLLVGNSSSGIIEAYYFDTPVINIGIRQKGRERGKNVIDVPSGSINQIKKGIKMGLQMKHERNISKDSLFGKGGTAKKIVKFLEKVELNDDLIEK